MKRLAMLVLALAILLTACQSTQVRPSDYVGDVEYTEAEGIYNKYQKWTGIYTRIQSPQTIVLPDGTFYDSQASYVEYTLEPSGRLTAVVGSPDNTYSSDVPLYIPEWNVPAIDFKNYACTFEDGIYFCKTSDGGEVRMREEGNTLYLFYNNGQWRLTV